MKLVQKSTLDSWPILDLCEIAGGSWVLTLWRKRGEPGACQISVRRQNVSLTRVRGWRGPGARPAGESGRMDARAPHISLRSPLAEEPSHTCVYMSLSPLLIRNQLICFHFSYTVSVSQTFMSLFVPSLTTADIFWKNSHSWTSGSGNVAADDNTMMVTYSLPFAQLSKEQIMKDVGDQCGQWPPKSEIIIILWIIHR